MTAFEARVAGRPTQGPAGWSIAWVDRSEGIARATNGETSVLLLVEGSGQEWWVTIRGRRIGVEVRSWRERVLAEAETSAQVAGGPVTVAATLPGLIVTVAVSVGDEVEAGATLLTIEAMKMQNEVRAPRSGRVSEVSVSSGQAVATGAPLLRLE
ncbi:MAG TPA: biotin/lipoyl-containing protein [Candidatus Limnocylindria bacterium]|jgi:acetyl/propionyl-CoA carboxylase alpha subunit